MSGDDRHAEEAAPVVGPARERPPADAAPTVDGSMGIVTIEGDGDMAKVCDEIEYLLVAGCAPIFQRGGMLVRVVEDASSRRGINRDVGAPRIVAFDDLALAEMLTRSLQIWRRNRKTQDLVRVDCPRLVAQTLLSRKQWSFRHLEAVVEHPVMLADGSVLWTDGYHAETGLFLALPLMAFQSPYDTPSRRDAEAALETLRDLLEGFPFLESIDESVALALLLTPFVRPILPTAPGFGIDAHTAGSGKSTLVKTGSVLATGRDPAFLSFGDDMVELGKVLFSSFLEGDQHVAIDNVVAPLDSPLLCVVLTSPVYRGRVLGQSLNANVPTKAVVTVNGNNLVISGDLTRRMLVVRLDPGCERPAERHFVFDPVDEVRQCRSDYVLAALTVMSAYIASGERGDVRPFGSFEDWSRMVREPLIWLGMEDPVDSIRALEAADPERTQLRAMLQATRDVMATRDFKAADLIATATKRASGQRDFGGSSAVSESDQAQLQEALQAVCERNGDLSVKALGRWLTRMQGRIEGGQRFVHSHMVKGSFNWKVDSVAESDPQGV